MKDKKRVKVCKEDLRDMKDAYAVARDFLNLTRCKGNRIISKNYRCTHCNSYDPQATCMWRSNDACVQTKQIISLNYEKDTSTLSKYHTNIQCYIDRNIRSGFNRVINWKIHIMTKGIILIIIGLVLTIYFITTTNIFLFFSGPVILIAGFIYLINKYDTNER